MPVCTRFRSSLLRRSRAGSPLLVLFSLLAGPAQQKLMLTCVRFKPFFHGSWPLWLVSYVPVFLDFILLLSRFRWSCEFWDLPITFFPVCMESTYVDVIIINICALRKLYLRSISVALFLFFPIYSFTKGWLVRNNMRWQRTIKNQKHMQLKKSPCGCVSGRHWGYSKVIPSTIRTYAHST